MNHLWSKFKLSAKGIALVALIFCLLILIPSQSWAIFAATPISLNSWTSPSSGVAGIDFVNITGSGFPAGHGTFPPAQATITFSLSCGGVVAGTANPTSIIHVLGSTYRMHVQLPATLASNNYFASVTGTTSDATLYSSTNCSEVTVTHTNPTLSACLPSSSLGVLAPTAPGPVIAYVPNGNWGNNTSGVQYVPLEGGGVPASIATAAGVGVNSCSSNPATGQTVCTANNTDVFLITGTTLTNTLFSSSNLFAGFSGGSCENCGVAINALTNKAVINMGVSGGNGDGFQVLDLNTNTFLPPTGTNRAVTENPSIDPTRGLVLSPSESFGAGGGSYDLLQINPITGALTEFTNTSVVSGRSLASQLFDSAGEDCSTGIALATDEGTSLLFITDLTQATFVPGAPGTWSAPSQFQNFPEFAGMGAGTSGISIAPGTAHLGLVAGEFGSNRIGVIQLPSTSGTGTPSVVDWVGTNLAPSFSLGNDPHTLTAYTSPNDGKAYGVLANTAPPSTLAVVDLACIMSNPGRVGHDLSPALAVSCIRYVATHGAI